MRDYRSGSSFIPPLLIGAIDVQCLRGQFVIIRALFIVDHFCLLITNHQVFLFVSINHNEFQAMTEIDVIMSLYY